MKIRVILKIIVVAFILEIKPGYCLFDPVSLGLGSLGIGLLGAGYHKYVKCKIFECCNDDHIPIDLKELRRRFDERLHGQHIVQSTVFRAISGYKATENPPKALAISFHGPVGTGKNFVAKMISEAFYKKGTESAFYNRFSGSTYSASRLDYHKDYIKETIVETLLRCERSIFVFDEVDSMPEGLLDVLLPFMDYGQPTFIEHRSRQIRLNSNRAIFIFLANSSERRILDRMLMFWKEGRKRDSLKLQDFENSISGDAVKENGGFLNSNTIKSSLIDYYVPFLPLEEEHVKLCMRDAFAAANFTDKPTAFMEEEVMSVVTYGPEPYNVYSKSGCKKIEQKVISLRALNYESTEL